MKLAAFDRALSYLKFNRLVQTLSLACSTGSALLLVAVLFVLFFLVDLLLSLGKIPSYADLPAQQQLVFRQTIEPATPERLDGWLQDVKALGIEQARMLELARRSELKDLPSRDIELRRSLLWWAELPARLETLAGIDAEATRNHLVEHIKAYGLDAALQRSMKNGGATGLVLRTQGTSQGWVIGPIVRLNGWMTYGNTVCLVGLFLMGWLLVVLRWGLAGLAQWYALRAALGAATRLRRAVYQHAYRLGTLGLATTSKTASSVALLEIDKVRKGIFTRMTVNLPEAIHIVLLTLFALWLHPWLAVIMGVLLGLSAWAMQLLRNFLRRRGDVTLRQAVRQARLFHESLEMVRLVKGYLMEPFNEQRVDAQLAALAEAQVRQNLGEALARPALMLAGLSIFLSVLFLAGFVLLHGFLEPATLLVMMLVMAGLVPTARRWWSSHAQLRLADESARVAFAYMERTDTMGQAIEAEFLPGIERGIEFHGVSLKDPESGRMLLKGVSFQIPAGQKAALLGLDETEKQAVVSLLARFLDPTQGEVRIDKKSLRWLTLDSVRAQSAYVLQDHLIFSDTVANNIGCGDSAYPLPKIIDAAKLAHAHQFIQKLPRGYDTPIGALGHALRPGEAFRIALARAILRDPSFVVIEEPITPFDDDTKAMIDDTLQRFLPERTTLFLAHRLSTIKGCDRIVLLHEGKVAGIGDHRELIASSDLYRHLQYLEFNEFANQAAG
jgi:ATP-binding cassette subfamily B protein